MRKNEIVSIRITTIATKSEIGAAYKIPLIPVPTSAPSKTEGNIIAYGVKQTISRITDAITAYLDFPIDWKNTAVILTRQVTVTRDK